MSQYYFRFIRYTSVNFREIYFLTYENSIESNLIRMIMTKGLDEDGRMQIRWGEQKIS